MAKALEWAFKIITLICMLLVCLAVFKAIGVVGWYNYFAIGWLAPIFLKAMGETL